MKSSISILLGISVAAVLLPSCSSYYDEHYQGAIAGNAADQYAIASCYDEGDRGVPEGKADKRQAASWYLKAAKQGHAEAQNNLGLLYRDGKGVPQDKEEAFEWFSKSAMQGNKYAQYNLGNMFSDMQCSFESDSPEHKYTADVLKKAAHWYALAAAQGHHGAQYQLARCYDRATYNNWRRTKGVFYDLGGDYKNVKAYWALANKWYSEAAKGGNEKYKEDYERFKKEGSAVMASANLGPLYFSEVAY